MGSSKLVYLNRDTLNARTYLLRHLGLRLEVSLDIILKIIVLNTEKEINQNFALKKMLN